MKKVLIFVVGALLISSAAHAQTYVQGYTRADGTYVQGHYRSERNDTKLDNYSTRGNVNPYTGERGTVDPYRQDERRLDTIAPTYYQPPPPRVNQGGGRRSSYDRGY